jgi:tight adherence protein C
MEFLSGIGSSLGLSPQLVFVFLIGATVTCLGLLVVGGVMGASDPMRRRLSSAVGDDVPAPTSSKSPKRDYSRFINPVEKYILPQDGEERSSTTERLIHAGFRSEKALPYFYGIKAAMALGLPLLVIVASSLTAGWSFEAYIFAIIFAAFIGVITPNIVLERLKESRLKKLRNGFPDALDLLVVCVEAGLGLGPAIDRVARDLEVSHEELANELSLVNVEIRAGVDRASALKNLAARSGLEDIRGLVGLLVQTMKFGTSIADALRVYSEEFRDKRMQAAEEQAAKIGTKLLFPLVVCLFPAFFVVAVGPAVLRMISVFSQMP